MHSHYFSKTATLLAASVAVAACSGSSDAPGAQEGTLSLALFDAPRWDVAAINLELTGVNVKPAGSGPALEFDFDPAIEVDLLSLTPDNAETLLDGVTVPAGAYNWIELEVNAAFDGSVNDSHVVEDAGGFVELIVPSGTVRLVSGFTVTANQETSFMIDWDVREGLSLPPGQDGYLLRPAFRIIDMTEYGTLEGTVAMDLITPATEVNRCNDDSVTDDPDEGNVVYVFAGAGADADDIDGIEAAVDPNVDPVATVEVGQDETGAYSYSTILTPGEYTVAFTCQAALDDPVTDDTLLFSPAVDIVIADDTTTVVDF